jgi:hypothetical protein
MVGPMLPLVQQPQRDTLKTNLIALSWKLSMIQNISIIFANAPSSHWMSMVTENLFGQASSSGDQTDRFQLVVTWNFFF